jgi:cell division cycle protein 20 (cofactor of APC complex)
LHLAFQASINLDVLYSSNNLGNSAKPAKAKKIMRHIPSAATRILDAPDLLDDYYLNLLSWSSTDVVAVALGPSVYLWNAKTGSTEELMSLEDENDYVSSIEWMPGGTNIALGTAGSQTQL